MSALDLDELARLERKATPGPWHADHDGHWDRDETQEYVHVAPREIEGHKALFSTLGCDLRKVEDEDGDERHHFRDVVGRANIELVAALRNAAPELIAAARQRDNFRAVLASIAASTPAAEVPGDEHELSHRLGLIQKAAIAVLEEAEKA